MLDAGEELKAVTLGAAGARTYAVSSGNSDSIRKTTDRMVARGGPENLGRRS